MSTIRKALLPTGIALAFLLFLGAVGSTPSAFAAVDVCGAASIGDGDAAAYWIGLADDDLDDEVGVEVNGGGTIIAQLDGEDFNDLETESTDEIFGLDVVDRDDLEDGLVALLEGHYGYDADDCDTASGHIALVIVECDDLGEYTVSFYSEDDNISGSIEVSCRGDVDTGTIGARPGSVEITPSYANVAHSLITVTLLDDNDEPAVPGNTVLFQTDRCSIEESKVDFNAVDDDATTVDFEAAENLFRALNALVPATAYNIESAGIAAGPMDSAPQLDETQSFTVISSSGTERTVAAAILHCDPVDAVGVTPGVANITAIVERSGDDLVLTTKVTVVGPPAANGVTVTASPASLICGEKATISVDVKDSIGQAVSDHTLVEAVTNAGGVLGGTGAVAGQMGLVSPISSTVAETFGGKATIYLLTSTQHVGKYEVVVTTGGGGGVTWQLSNGGNTTNLLGGLFTTAPISVQVTVECSVPAAAPAPTVKAPATGQGITPPSTGDAGLATSESSSLTLVIGAVVAAMVFGGLVITRVRQD